MKRNLLIVDDEIRLLNSFKREMHQHNLRWNIYTVKSGPAALKLLEDVHIDAIISDLRMPSMDGYELLSRVKDQYPSVARIMLTGQLDLNSYAENVQVCHLFLYKPIRSQSLQMILGTIYSLTKISVPDKLKHLLSDLSSLPVSPMRYDALVRLLGLPDMQVEEMARIISLDISMSMQIFRLANTLMIDRNIIRSPEDAIMILGRDTLRSLVLDTKIFSRTPEEIWAKFESANPYQRSLDTARYAGILTAERTNPCTQQYAILGGLLHDIGTLIINFCFPDKAHQIDLLVKSRQLSVLQAEKLILGTDHATIGGYLAMLWGFPQPISQAIYRHHAEMPPCANNSEHEVATAVWHANQISLGHKAQSTFEWKTIEKDSPKPSQTMPGWMQFAV